MCTNYTHTEISPHSGMLSDIFYTLIVTTRAAAAAAAAADDDDDDDALTSAVNAFSKQKVGGLCILAPNICRNKWRIDNNKVTQPQKSFRDSSRRIKIIMYEAAVRLPLLIKLLRRLYGNEMV